MNSEMFLLANTFSEMLELNLRDINYVSILLRIILALICGGILGVERGRKNRPAGLRTYMLVCLGAAIVMMTNQYVYEYFGTSDPVRMGAQVISGIGFLGAGTIITTGRNQVKGVTTAAGLWAAACCGLAIGIGFYEMALFGTISILAVMFIMQYADQRIRKRNKLMEVYMELEYQTPIGILIEYARNNGIDIFDLQIKKAKFEEERYTTLVFTAQTKVRQDHNDTLKILSEAKGARYVEELH